MKKIIIPLCLIMCTQFIGCANDSPSCEDTYLYFAKEHIDKVPYKDSTELTFINSVTNDTLIFSGQGWDSSYVLTHHQIDCVQKVFLGKREIVFFDKKDNDTLTFRMQTQMDGRIDFYVTIRQHEFAFPWRWPEKIGTSQYTINGHLYTDVLQFKNALRPEFSSNYNCYYSESFGIIKIETVQGNLELYKIKI